MSVEANTEQHSPARCEHLRSYATELKIVVSPILKLSYHRRRSPDLRVTDHAYFVHMASGTHVFSKPPLGETLSRTNTGHGRYVSVAQYRIWILACAGAGSPGLKVGSSTLTRSRNCEGARLYAPGLETGLVVLIVSRKVLGERLTWPSLSTFERNRPIKKTAKKGAAGLYVKKTKKQRKNFPSLLISKFVVCPPPQNKKHGCCFNAAIVYY